MADGDPNMNDEERVAYLAAEHAPARSERAPAASAEPLTRRTRRPGTRPRWPAWRPVAAILAVPAAVVAAVVVLALAGGGRSAAPERFAADLYGTRLAPSASGTVTLTRTVAGWRVSLNGRGLPRLDDGFYYEAWLRGPTGALVPVGTFNAPTGITLWAGVPPKDFPTFTITRQRADGDPASSGQRVLQGGLRRVQRRSG